MKNPYLFLLMGALLSACSSGDPSIEGDQLSAQLIESTTPSLGNDAWLVGAEPELIFGIEEGDENFQFHRVYSVLQLSNGTVIVSNSGTHQLRFFDSNGNFIKSVGQNGRGPGDFGDFSSMRLYRTSNDAFVVNDNGNDRVQIFSNDGELVSVLTMEKIENFGNPSVTNVFTDGGWFIWSVIGNPGFVGNPGDIIQQVYGFHRLHPDWTYDKLLYETPTRPRFVNDYQGIPNYPFIPLTADPIYITDSTNGALFSEGLEPIITRIDTAGAHTHTYRWDLPRTKTDSMWERYKQEYYLDPLESDPFRRGQYEHFLSKDLPIPDNIPAISELKIDVDGNIWAKRFELPWDESEVWDVLSPDGNWITSIKTPFNFTFTEIGSDYLLGYTQQNVYTEIVKFPLIKNSEQ